MERAKVRQEAEALRRSILREVTGCELCGFGVKPVLQMHHRRPVSKGGVNHPGEVLMLCPNCHALVHEAARRQFGKRNLPPAQRQAEGDRFFAFRSEMEDALGPLLAERIWELAGEAGR